MKRFGREAFNRAIENVAYSRRLMFMHAYQSFVFNKMVSARLRLYGSSKLVEGDLVRDAETDTVVAISSAQAQQLNDDTENPLELAVLPLAGTNVKFPTNAVGDEYTKVRRAQYRAWQLCAGDTRSSPCCACAWVDTMRQLLEEHGTKAFLAESGSLKGSYRSLLARPTDLEWRFEPESRVVRASFSLPSGSFATMCLREILQSDL